MGRIQLDQANWHVTARGARRLLLFHDDADYKVFYAMLGESCLHSEMSLIADCLMSNHFHLSLDGSTRQLTSCMQRLNRAYSGYHNHRYGLTGHAFEQRYYGEPIPSDFILKRVVRYIHLNPVRGGKTSSPENYPWSSYRRMAFASQASLSPREQEFLKLFPGDLSQAQESYRLFTEVDLARRVTFSGGHTPAWEIWQEQFRWMLEHLQEQSDFLSPLEPEVLAVYFGTRVGIPPRAMGKAMGHPDGRIASEMKRRVLRRLENDPSLQQKLDSLQIL